MRKIKLTKNKLYGLMSNGGVGLSMIGVGTFLTNYVSGSHMNPTLTLSSIGVITIGGLSSFYGTLRQKYSKEEQEIEEDDLYENIYDLDLLDLQSKELKLVEKRFEIERLSMDPKIVNLINYNLLKEKLLIKKVLESLDTDLPSVEEEDDLIISMILESGYDEDYLNYREKVLSSNVIDFPKYKTFTKKSDVETKILEFPKNSNN